ncbi:hypothetical protein D3Z55_02495 [Clostridiaceae bacterium]|nr:hypothetical protein [Lachnospiraceae bacterium]NBH16370.1 hypothetical protein [Clostridiaceae bacterium]
MRRIWMWFYLSCKRHVLKGAFLVVLMLLPVGAFWIYCMQNKEQGGIRIAVCREKEEDQRKETGSSLGQGTKTRQAGNEEGGELEQKLVAALTGRPADEGLFQFYECENERQVREEVASRRAECGYVIGAGLKERLDRKNYKRVIRVYSAPSTIAAYLSSETVFAALIELYDRDLFVQYIQKVGDNEAWEHPDQLAKRAGQLYDQWLGNGSTFHFTYETVGQGKMPEEDSLLEKEMVFWVRGIVAVYVFVAGLYGAAMSLKDEKKGLFLQIPYKSRTLCQMAAMAAPVFLAAVSGLAAVWAGNCSQALGYELAVMTAYGAAVVVFSWGVRLVCGREELVCCLIPFFLVGSLVFCPVFLDIGKYMPEFRLWGRLFLPGYYIRMF